MSAQTTEEVPFLRGFERAPDGEEAETTKLKFWIDGRLAALKGVIEGLMNTEERGPRDYAENERELKNLIFEAARIGAQNGGYTESPKSGPDAWAKWMVTVCGMLAVAGIGSAVGMYGKLSAIEANQISQQKQIDYLTQLIVRRTP